jgi:TonB family protein
MRLLWLLYGIFRLGRFSRMALCVPTPAAAAEIEDALGVSARYIQQTGGRGPWTFGWMRAAVALPAGFDSLAPSFQRAVICHELLHIKRRDVVVAFFEELAVAALWFHPWIWLLRARIRVAREQVVDARAVEILGNRDEYVRCLVNISGHDLAPHFSQAGAGMLRARELRARVDAIFQEAHMSSRHLAAATFALLMAIGATTYVAGAALPMRSQAAVNPSIPQRQSLTQAPVTTTRIRLNPATNEPINLKFTDARLRDVLAMIGHATSVVFAGYEASFDEPRSVTIEATIDATTSLETLLDRLLTPNGLMYTVTGPRTVVIARSPLAQVRQAQAALERERRQINKVYPEYPQDALDRGIQGTVVVDITVNVAGDVTTAAVASGPRELHASAFKAALGLKYTPGSSTTAMKIAFHYTLSGSSWGVRITDVAPNISPRPPMTQGPPAPSAGPDSTGAYRIGGAITPPKKIKDAPPKYPEVAQQARVQGVVILEARIDEHGNVSDTRTLRSIPLLDQAAIDAVKQWQYTPTLMNGVAVPVLMTVTVNFSLRQLFQIQLTLPDGSTPLFGTLAKQPMMIEVPGVGRVHFQVVDPSDSSSVTVSVFAADGETHLGNVTLALGAPAVQSPTSPSFGMQFVGFR